VTIPTIPTGPTGGSWPPAKITLFTRIYNVLADIWQFTWTQEVPVTINVTVTNESPYTSAILSYRILNLDTNVTVRNWTSGEPVQINSYNTTLLTINTVVPIKRDFTPEHFKMQVKLSQTGQDLESEATFTVEKATVQQFYGNVALVGLCMGLVGIAYFSYTQKEEPWKKYPIEQKRKWYPKREGKKYPEPKRRKYPTRKGKK
jgi:hypothetical protein